MTALRQVRTVAPSSPAIRQAVAHDTVGVRRSARTRTLLAACGFGAIALVAVAVLLVLGLKGSARTA